MMVGLYTSRIVLKTLGIDDYGVYNVVAGVVAMFSLMTSSLSAAISRYLTFNLGKGETEKLSCVFASSLNIMIVMAVIILIVGEIVGVWVLNSELNIPADRMDAANWVFHFSVIGFAINLIAVPYNASIIAHERQTCYLCCTADVCDCGCQPCVWCLLQEEFRGMPLQACVRKVSSKRDDWVCRLEFLWEWCLSI